MRMCQCCLVRTVWMGGGQIPVMSNRRSQTLKTCPWEAFECIKFPPQLSWECFLIWNGGSIAWVIHYRLSAFLRLLFSSCLTLKVVIFFERLTGVENVAFPVTLVSLTAPASRSLLFEQYYTRSCVIAHNWGVSLIIFNANFLMLCFYVNWL